MHKCFLHVAVLSGSGREGGGGQSQGFPGEQHLFCWRPLHNGPVCVRLGSSTQPLRPAGPAPPQPHGNYARYRHTHYCVQHDQQVTGGSFIQSLVTWTRDVLTGDRQRPDWTTRKTRFYWFVEICGSYFLVRSIRDLQLRPPARRLLRLQDENDCERSCCSPQQ